MQLKVKEKKEDWESIQQYEKTREGIPQLRPGRESTWRVWEARESTLV